MSLIRVGDDEFDGKVRVVITKAREGRWAQQIVADHPKWSDGGDRRSSADFGEFFERVQEDSRIMNTVEWGQLQGDEW